MFANRIKIKTKDGVILHQSSNMLYRGMVDQFLRVDKRRLLIFHTKDLYDISSAFWENRKTMILLIDKVSKSAPVLLRMEIPHV